MADVKDKLLTYWKSHDRTIRVTTNLGAKSVGVLLLSYLLASSASTIFIGFLSDAAIQSYHGVPAVATRPDLRKSLNYREVRRTVVGRNIFNSSGELPDESDPNLEDTNESGIFNADDKCIKSSLPLSLVGIIYSGDLESSLATVREKGYREADVYRAGDAILGQDQAVVYAVQQKRLVINNNGVKECLEISAVKGPGFSSSPSSEAREPVKLDSFDSDDLATIQVSSSFVEEALGPGFAKILESGRLVPYNRDGSMIGFKLIGVKSKSLWKKINLNSGDVITSVNGMSMAQPDKGFALYEALQNERQINIGVLKKGKTPSNISVEIK